MTDRVDARLADVLARQEVIEAIDALFVATDNKDWDAVAACFAPQVHFDMSSAGGGAPATRTSAEIAGGWQQGLAPIQAIHHQAGNYRVRVTDDRANAFCYGIAYHYLPKKSGRNTRVFVGSYEFELARGEGRWQITSFRYSLKFVDGNRELEQGE
jgi:3-phenylpropionate/cinnamic acid dioxygenase small subunit